MNLKEFKAQFDEYCSSYIQQKLSGYEIFTRYQNIKKYLDYIEDFVLAGGKRIRPYLCYLTYKTFSGKEHGDIWKFILLFEFLHDMALIHDDIIDNGHKRHGIPTFHRFIEEHLSPLEQAEHLGMSQALLIGDLLFSRTYELLYSIVDFPSASLEIAQKNVQTMIEEVILGQMIDVDMMCGTDHNEQKLEVKNHYKSASYTFIRPMMTGIILAGGDQNEIEQIKSLGENLGLAYQMRDDLLDIIPENSDKTLCSDIQDGQPTYLTAYIHNLEDQTFARQLEQYRKKPMNEQDQREVKNIFISSGAIDYGKKLLDVYLDNAKKIIEQIPFSDSSHKKLFDDIIYLLQQC